MRCTRIRNRQCHACHRLNGCVKLLDAHLDGTITKDEYLPRKERFLNERIQIEETLSKFTKEAMPWLEPCRNFIQAAAQASLLAISEDRGAKKEFIQKAGSNHRLVARRLTWGWREPWLCIMARSHSP